MDKQDLEYLLDKLVSLPKETEWVEFKSGGGRVSPEQIGEYISAMSNGATISNQPFGYLVWGIEDVTHRIIGTSFHFNNKKKGNQDLELWIRNLFSPKINFEIFEFFYQHNNVVLLRIPAARGEPTFFKKIPYIRIGSNKTDLRNYPDYLRIIYNSLEDWSAVIINKASIDDLDPEAVKIAREKFKEKHNQAGYYKEIDSWDNRTFLDKAKITIKGQITRTALILLGKEESSHYLLPSIAEITWKLETEEKAYEHFGLPFLTSTTNVLNKIRNYEYKFFPSNQLLATTVTKYDTRTILEALHNCIAHQDYTLNSRIIVTEKSDKLIFTNAGNFFEGNPEDYIEGDKTPEKYRNPWLAHAMVNLGMIDRLGYGIYTMYVSQRNRFFPLPDYILSNRDHVVLQIYGHFIDENYSKLLIEKKDLPLSDVILLDKVQKRQPINDHAASMLRRKGLIEGRKPNYFVSASIAGITRNKADYIKQKAFDKSYYKNLILEFLNKYDKATRKDIDDLLLDKLSSLLSLEQKRNKIRNLLYEMSRKDKTIYNASISTNKPLWVLSDDKIDKIKKDDNQDG